MIYVQLISQCKGFFSLRRTWTGLLGVTDFLNLGLLGMTHGIIFSFMFLEVGTNEAGRKLLLEYNLLLLI